MQAVGGIIQPTEDLTPGHTLIFQAKGQLTVGIHVEKLTFGVLENRPHLPGQLVKRLFPHRRAVEQDLSGQRAVLRKCRDQAVDQLRDGGLSAAGSAAEQDTLARSDGQIHMGEGAHFFCIGKGHILQLYHGNTPNLAARRAAVNPTPTTNAALSTGEARSSTRLVLGAGSSIPRVTAAADSSSAVPVAETIRGTMIPSSFANPRTPRNRIASRI